MARICRSNSRLRRSAILFVSTTDAGMYKSGKYRRAISNDDEKEDDDEEVAMVKWGKINIRSR